MQHTSAAPSPFSLLPSPFNYHRPYYPFCPVYYPHGKTPYISAISSPYNALIINNLYIQKRYHHLSFLVPPNMLIFVVLLITEHKVSRLYH